MHPKTSNIEPEAGTKPATGRSVEATPHNHTHSRDQNIRDLAFSLWQEAGSPPGRSEEFWYQACAIEDTPDTTALAGMNHNSITRP